MNERCVLLSLLNFASDKVQWSKLNYKVPKTVSLLGLPAQAKSVGWDYILSFLKNSPMPS